MLRHLSIRDFVIVDQLYLAFRLALRAHNVSGVQRAQLYAAIRQRLRQQPWSFLWPSRADAASASTA